MSQTPVVFYDFANGLAQNPDGSLPGKVNNCVYHPLQPGVDIPTWGPLAHCLEFKGPGSYISLPAAPALQNLNAFTVELVIQHVCHDEERVTLMEGQALPFALYLLKQSGQYHLAAAVNLADGWKEVLAAESALQPNIRFSVSLVYTGDALCLLVGGLPVARRIFQDGDLTPAGDKPFYVGTGSDGKKWQYQGVLYALRMYDGVAEHLETGLALAEQLGMGEIWSKYLDLGGENSLLHRPKGPEKKAGAGLYREFDQGNLYWSPATGVCMVPGKFRDYYVQIQGPLGRLGFPLADMEELPIKEPVSYVLRCENGAMYFSQPTGVHALYGEIYQYYISNGCEYLTGPVTFPASDISELPSGWKTCDFLNGVLYQHPDKGEIILHSNIATAYEANDPNRSEWGWPTVSSWKIKNSKGNFIGETACFEKGLAYWHPQHGTHFLPMSLSAFYEIEGRGPTGPLGFPTSEGQIMEGFEYFSFENGIIQAKDLMNFHLLTGVRLRFGQMSTKEGDIDDGVADSAPELVTYTTVKINDELIEDRVRRPKSYAGTSFELGTKYPAKGYLKPLRLSTRIYVKITVYDWDEWSDNDYLGTIEKTFTIKDFFDLAKGTTMGVLTLSDKGADTDKLQSIKLEYSLHTEDLSGLDPKAEHFRHYYFWSFDNFRTDFLGHNLFAQTFSDVGSELAPLYFLKLIFYDTVYRTCAAKGNCFGMCLAALNSMRDNSDFQEPVYARYKAIGGKRLIEEADLPKDYREKFNRKQGYQLGAANVLNLIDKLANKKTEMKCLTVYENIKAEVQAGKRPLVSMVDTKDTYRAHAVLAYKCEDGLNGQPHKIWIADPNDPWSEKNKNYQNDCTYIEIKPSPADGFRSVNTSANYASTDLLPGIFLPNEFLYVTPYKTVSHQPVTPVGLIPAALLFALLIVSGDAGSKQVEVDGKPLMGVHNQRRAFYRRAPGEMIRIPISGQGAATELYAAAKERMSRVRISAVGKRTGNYRADWFTRFSQVTLQAPVTVKEEDLVELTDLNSSRPGIRLRSGSKGKTVQVNLQSLRDTAGRHNCKYSVKIPITSKADAQVRLARRGGGLEIEPACAGDSIVIAIERRAKNKPQSFRLTCSAKGADETIWIRPRAVKNALADVVVERRRRDDRRLLARTVKKA